MWIDIALGAFVVVALAVTVALSALYFFNGWTPDGVLAFAATVAISAGLISFLRTRFQRPKQ